MQITRGVTAKAQKVVIYGTEGIGKTSFASQFPDPLFIDTEGSTSNMDLARLEKPSSWTYLLQQIDFVKQNMPCKTLVIDTIDWAERLGIEFIVTSANKKSITNFGYGEGFIQLEEEFGRFLNKLSDLVELGINVVLTAHAKITKFEQPDEMGAYDRWELKLGNKTTAKTASLVKEWADMVLFANYKTFSVAADENGKRHKGQGGVRTFYANHHPAWDAKNRHGLPDEFPMDYAQIAHIFNAVPQAPPVYQPTAPAPVAVAPPVQQPAPQATPVVTELPQQPTQLVPQQTAVIDIDPAIPQSLRDLMALHEVTEAEIQLVVSTKGYYPAGTPILNYDPGFIDGVLVGAWNQVYEMVVTDRGLPF